MPSTAALSSPPRTFLLYSKPGGGKTTLFRTLPAKKPFAYIFDPNSLGSLQGADPPIDYEIFLPDHVSTVLGTLSEKDQTAVSRARSGVSKEDPQMEPLSYVRFREHWAKATRDGLWAQYDAFLFDGCTFFMKLLQDREVWINNRLGGAMKLDDYTPVMTAFWNNLWDVIGGWQKSGYEKPILFTAHEDSREDPVLKRDVIALMVTGTLRQQVPGMFSEVIRLTVDDGGRHLGRIKPDGRSPAIRTTLKIPEDVVDLTIEDWKNPTKYGLGKWYFPKASPAAAAAKQ